MKTLSLLGALSLFATMALAQSGVTAPPAASGNTGAAAGASGGLVDTPGTTTTGRSFQGAPVQGSASSAIESPSIDQTPSNAGSGHDPASTPVRPALPVAPSAADSRVIGTGAGTDRAPGSSLEK